MLEGSGISPFSQRGLDVAFGFAVGLRGVRLNPDVLDSELFAGAGEGFGEVAATIVSHDAFDGNAEAPEVGDGGDQERDGPLVLNLYRYADGLIADFSLYQSRRNAPTPTIPLGRRGSRDL
jgi:hypothetical protein